VEDRAAMFSGLAASTMSRDDSRRFYLLGRFVFHSLREAESCLQRLDNRPTARVGANAEALRLLGRARSELEFLRPEELLDDLPALLLGLQETIRDVGEAVSLQFFHAAPWVAWTAPEVV
jgi:uncharacterized alpha-E superfamily protein